MGQARDEAGNIWETDAQGNAVRLVQAAGSKSITLGQADQKRPYDVQSAAANATAAASTAPYAGPTAEADLQRKQQQVGDRGAERGDKLRADFNSRQEVKEYRTALVSLMSGLKAAPDPGGDNALIYAYAKAMDPGSVVRESEMGMASGTGSFLEGAVGNLKKQLGWDGGGLAPEVRERLKREMNSKVASLAKGYGVARGDFQALARSQGVNPEDVVGTLPATPFLKDYERLRPRAAAPKDPYADLTVPNQLTADENVTQNTPTGGGGAYPDSILSQGMSGVNEGIGNTLGAPVDIMTAALNLVPQGINKIANTSIPTIEDPMFGSEWWKQNVLSGTINPETTDPTNRFVRRVGQSVGGAAIPVAATATTPMRAIAGILASGGGGTGAATAQQVAPGNPWAEMAGDVAGSLLVGGGSGQLAARTARKGAEAAVPSIADLKNQASNLYSQAESRGIVAGPNVTGNLSGKVRQIAQDEALITPTGRVSGDYPRAAEAMKLLDDYSGKDMSVKDIQVVRDTLSDAVQATEGKERRIARQMLDAFDAETTPLAPELSAARKTASKYLSAGQVQKAIDLAEPRAAQYSQSGTSNALKTEFRNLDRNIVKGNEQFDPAVVEAINNVSRGTPVTQALTRVGKLAPTGPVSGAVSAGIPFAVGNAFGGPAVGAAASGATMSVGTIAKLLADKAVARNADVAEILARNGGAIQVPNVVDEDLMRQIAAQLSAQTAPYATR